MAIVPKKTEPWENGKNRTVYELQENLVNYSDKDGNIHAVPQSAISSKPIRMWGGQTSAYSEFGSERGWDLVEGQDTGMWIKPPAGDGSTVSNTTPSVENRNYSGPIEGTKDNKTAVLLSDGQTDTQSLGITQRALGALDDDEALLKRSGSVLLR